MNGITKGKAIGYLTAIFVAGCLAGSFAGFGYGRRATARPPSPRAMTTHILNHLRAELKLTDDQMAKITPVVEQTSAEIRAIHESSGKNVLALVQKSDQQIGAFLDDDQKRKLAELQKNREKSFDKSFKGERRRRPPGPLDGPLDGPPPAGPPERRGPDEAPKQR